MRVVLSLTVLVALTSCSHQQSYKSTAQASRDANEARPKTAVTEITNTSVAAQQEEATQVAIHKVVLHTTADVNLRVKWLRGTMYPTVPGRPASFDDTKSFHIEIHEGLISLRLDEIARFLDKSAFRDSGFRHAKLQAQNGKLRLSGTLTKIVPVPVQLVATPGVAPDHKRVRLHIEKLSALRLPVKKLLGTFHVSVDDLFEPRGKQGIYVNGDDIDIDMNKLLPPPRSEGFLVAVRAQDNGELLEYYGTTRDEGLAPQTWRNFIRLRGGFVTFGKLTMHHADLLMVDSTPSDWFNFDVNDYQEQLVAGITHITPEAGLQIFLPDATKLPRSARLHRVGTDWKRSLQITPSSDVDR